MLLSLRSIFSSYKQSAFDTHALNQKPEAPVWVNQVTDKRP